MGQCLGGEKGKAEQHAGGQAKSDAERAAQNPSVHGLGRVSATNALGRMSMSKPTNDELERASVVKMQH